MLQLVRSPKSLGVTAPFVRFASKKSGGKKAAEAPKVDQRQLAAQREREQKRMQLKRDNQRAINRLRDEAKRSLELPNAMDIQTAMKYIRAAEVGRPAHATTLTLCMRIVSEKGAAKLSGTCRLPKPLDEEIICVVTNDNALAEEARKAGASIVGGDDLITAIAEGREPAFDRMYATPEVMSRLTTVARILGPRGLMPNAKRGTVTSEIGAAISAARGEMSFKQSDTMLLLPIGRASFTDAEIVHNILTATNRVRELLAQSQAAKSGYIGRALLTSTSSPSIAIEV